MSAELSRLMLYFLIVIIHVLWIVIPAFDFLDHLSPEILLGSMHLIVLRGLLVIIILAGHAFEYVYHLDDLFVAVLLLFVLLALSKQLRSQQVYDYVLLDRGTFT